MGEASEMFPPAANTDLQQIVQSTQAVRRRLRGLPWQEKLEMLDKLGDRHQLLRQTRPPAASVSR